MTYRIDLDRPVADEIRRVIRDQLDGAVGELRAPGGPDADGIHDARKSIKKARSAVRLARPLFGAGVARQANAELREAATSIASQRDADARVEAIDRLRHDTSADHPGRPAVELLRQRGAAEAERARAAGSVGASTAHGAARQMQLTGDWLGRVPARADGWDAIEGGLRRQYARGRKALHRLGPSPSDEDLHDWRKRAKDLWYHERLLRDLWPSGLKPYVRTASHLADLLGDDHDLSLVHAFTQAAPDLDPEARHAATAVIGDRRKVLLAEARSLGALVYADHPDAWTARHHAWWAARTDSGGEG